MVRLRVRIALVAIRAGNALWRAIKPWRRLKGWRNRRRLRKGLPPLPITEEDDKVFPQGTMRKSGALAMGAAPVIGMAVKIGATFLGVGDECTAEAVEAGCMTAEQFGDAAGGVITSVMALVGGLLYWKGFNRAQNAGSLKP